MAEKQAAGQFSVDGPKIEYRMGQIDDLYRPHGLEVPYIQGPPIRPAVVDAIRDDRKVYDR